jgi:hypothetical protein
MFCIARLGECRSGRSGSDRGPCDGLSGLPRPDGGVPALPRGRGYRDAERRTNRLVRVLLRDVLRGHSGPRGRDRHGDLPTRRRNAGGDLHLVEIPTSKGVVQFDSGVVTGGTGVYAAASGVWLAAGPITFDGDLNHPNLRFVISLR